MKKTIVILIIIATILIGIGIIISLTTKESPKEKIPEEHDEVLEEDPSTKYTKLKEIKTQDNKISLLSTTAYYSEDSQMSGVNIKILSQENINELYLKVTFTFKNDKEERIIYLEGIEANKTILYVIQSNKDYSKITSWKVTRLTKEEAEAAGFVFE